MKLRLPHILFSLILLGLVLSNCTNKKNTLITRTYHNITSRYNGYYWATESIKDGVFKIESGFKEDYSKILPMFIYPDNNSSKTIYPEMDKAIKKSSLVIQRHAIIDKKTKKEVYGAVKWIDDNWIVIGKAHFFKREFFSAVEILDYVAKSYKGKQKYEAQVWLIRVYNEIGTLSQSEPIIAALKNDKNFPGEFKKDLSALISEFYIKQGLYDEAAKELENTISLTKNRKKKARYNFILAQISEMKKDNKSAVRYYNRCIGLKPDYEMVFNARIKKSRLYDAKDQKIKGVKQELLKMAKDPKNEEYLDVIYYTLGEIEEKGSNIDQAMSYYKKSARSSVNNNNQKALSYLKLADNSFEKTLYVNAGSYYDSAVAVLDKKHPDYETIVNKQKNLSALIENINIIRTQDSLQKMVKDTVLRNKVIAGIIKQVEEEEIKKKEELENLKNQNDINAMNPNTSTQPNTNFNAGEWYFYNPATKSYGVNEFSKKYGTRKLEDNWRRANKQTSLDPLALESKNEDDTTGGKTTAVPKENDRKKKEFYLQGLPVTEEARKASDEKILEAYYQLGSIYREALNNRVKAMSSFDEMNKRFPGNKYEANTLYQGHRMATAERDKPRVEKYYAALRDNYPASDYFKILSDPEYATKELKSKNEVEEFYTATYNLYSESKYSEVYDRTTKALKEYGKNDFTARFALLRAMTIGRLQGMDSMERALTSIIANFSADPVRPKAQELLDYIASKKGVKPANSAPVEIFNVEPKAEHYWVCLLPKDFLGENSFKAKLSDFNTKYFSNAGLEATSFNYGEQGLIFVKKFKDKDVAMNYYQTIFENDEAFKGATLNKNKCTLFVISQDNFQKMIQQKKLEDYYQFFIKNYPSEPNK
jgi:hypothetical protein